MKIRTRLTLWYVGVLLISLVIMGGGMYYELVVERRLIKAQGKHREPMEDEVAEVMLIYCVPSVLITIAGGWWMTKRSLAPLDALTQRAERLQVHTLREPLPYSGKGDEIDRLAAVLNSMTQRLEHSFLQMRDFSLHASHEMKTPLAVLHGEVEMCLQDPAATPDQKEAYLSLLDEIQRLTKIVSGLALLARADAGQSDSLKECVDLSAVVKDAVADAEMLGQALSLQIHLKHCEPVTLQGDRHRLRQLLLNLTENALKYNVSRGSIDYSLLQSKDEAVLTISNTGPGITADKLPRVFERFFRGDSAHSSEVEGCGLGLSIAQSIVQNHGGSIEITSTPNVMTTVSVRLPLASDVNPHSTT